MSYTPFNAPLLAGLLGDREIAGQFSVQLELQCMVKFEIALAKAQGEAGVISIEASEAIQSVLPTYKPDLEGLGQGTTQDGIVPPEFVRQLCELVGEPHAKKVHFGGTSQDVTDTSAMMRLRTCVELLSDRLNRFIADLYALDKQQGTDQQSGNLLNSASPMVKLSIESPKNSNRSLLLAPTLRWLKAISTRPISLKS